MGMTLLPADCKISRQRMFLPKFCSQSIWNCHRIFPSIFHVAFRGFVRRCLRRLSDQNPAFWRYSDKPTAAKLASHPLRWPEKLIREKRRIRLLASVIIVYQRISSPTSAMETTVVIHQCRNLVMPLAKSLCSFGSFPPSQPPG